MNLVPIAFDEYVIHEVAAKESGALEITLPEPLNDGVWERLLVIKELAYPLPIIVTFSPSWHEKDLKNILTQLAASFVSGVSLKNSINKSLVEQINIENNLGLAIFY